MTSLHNTKYYQLGPYNDILTPAKLCRGTLKRSSFDHENLQARTLEAIKLNLKPER